MPILLMLLYYFSFSAFLMPLSRLMKMFWRWSFKCFHFSLFPACFHPHPKWHAPFLVMKMSHFPFQHSIHNKAWMLTISFEKTLGIKDPTSFQKHGLNQKPTFDTISFPGILCSFTWHDLPIFSPRDHFVFGRYSPTANQKLLFMWIFGSTELGVHCECAFPELGVLPGLTQKNVFFRAK